MEQEPKKIALVKQVHYEVPLEILQNYVREYLKKLGEDLGDQSDFTSFTTGESLRLKGTEPTLYITLRIAKLAAE